MSQLLIRRVRTGLVVAAITALTVAGQTTGTASAAPQGGAAPAPAQLVPVSAPAVARKHQVRAAKARLGWDVVYRGSKGPTAGRAVYRATALVRSRTQPTRTKVKVIQIVQGRVAATRSTTVRASPSSWRRVNISLKARPQASTVQVLVKRRKQVQVSTVRVTPATRTGSVMVVPPAPTPPTPPAIVPKPPVVTPSTPPVTVPTPPVVTPPVTPPPPPPAPPATTPVPAGWTMDMSEDFDTLASTRWNIKNNTYASNEDSYLLARNTSVNDGVLRIQGKLESVGGRNYTSGYVDTIGKYSLPNHFRAEVRAKVPFEQGLWAAPLWFRPTTGGVGEIDLVETYGNERAKPTFHQTIHTEYGSTHKQASITKQYSVVGSATATDWHTYTIEKVPGRTTMWVDGVKTAEFTPANPSLVQLLLRDEPALEPAGEHADRRRLGRPPRLDHQLVGRHQFDAAGLHQDLDPQLSKAMTRRRTPMTLSASWSREAAEGAVARC